MEYPLLIFFTWILLGLGCVEGIVKGSLAKIGECPHMVAIINDGMLSCGGALIGAKHVLTAAHCVDLSTSHLINKVHVLVGVTDRDDLSSGKRIKPAAVSRYPNYVYDGLIPFHDIAVLTLDEPITESEFVKIIDLPEPMKEYPPTEELTLFGFGSQIREGYSSKHLKKLSTRAVSRDACQNEVDKYNYNRTIIPGQLCALSGACTRDSGGPLTTNNQVIVGVSSLVLDPECGTDAPDVYTRVSHYVDFIRHEMLMSTFYPGTRKNLQHLADSLPHVFDTLKRESLQALTLMSDPEGNVNAKPGQSPNMVAIVSDYEYMGGGVLLSNRHVLTAAQVVHNYATETVPNFEVYVGSGTRFNFDTSKTYQVDFVSVHPNYTWWSHDVNDIAVVTLKTPITETELVKIVALPEPMQEYLPDTQFIMYCFGDLSVGLNIPPVMEREMSKVAVTLNTFKENRTKPGQLCAHADKCWYEIGNPLLTSDGKVAIGIVSDTHDPYIFTRVSHYVDFITNEMKPKYYYHSERTLKESLHNVVNTVAKESVQAFSQMNNLISGYLENLFLYLGL